MASAYAVEARLAVEAERRGDALAAVVRWGLAAHAAETDRERVAALGAALRSAELALHQAIHTARGRKWPDQLSWRALARAAGMPVATLNRRYRRKPARTAPEPVVIEDEEEAERLVSNDWEPPDESEWETSDDWFWEPSED